MKENDQSKIPVIILWNRVFERYEVYASYGHRYSNVIFEHAVEFVKNSRGLVEVPINSKIGRQLLSMIGTRKP